MPAHIEIAVCVIVLLSSRGLRKKEKKMSGLQCLHYISHYNFNFMSSWAVFHHRGCINDFPSVIICILIIFSVIGELCFEKF